MRLIRAGLCVLFVGSGAGCVKSDIERLENQVQLLDKRVELLQQDQEKSNAQLLDSWRKLRQQLDEQLGSMQRSSAQGSTRLDDVVQEMRSLADRIERTGMQYQRLSEQLAEIQDRIGQGGTIGMTPTDGNSPQPAVGDEGEPAAAQDQPDLTPSEENPPANGENPVSYEPAVDPNLTYKAAYSDFAQGNFKLAIVNFQTYVRQFPTSAKAVLAQYFIGESYYALGQYREAVAAFDKVVTGWPGDEKVPVAYLKKGYALLAMGQKALGVGVLQELINKYPNTHEALLARERLAAI